MHVHLSSFILYSSILSLQISAKFQSKTSILSESVNPASKRLIIENARKNEFTMWTETVIDPRTTIASIILSAMNHRHPHLSMATCLYTEASVFGWNESFSTIPSSRGGGRGKHIVGSRKSTERAKKWSSSIVRGFRQSIIASQSLFNGFGCERCTRVLQGVLSSFTRVICSLIQFSNFPPTSEISSDFHGWNGNERSVFISGTPPLCR